jgi:hypothetical protein
LKLSFLNNLKKNKKMNKKELYPLATLFLVLLVMLFILAPYSLVSSSLTSKISLSCENCIVGDCICITDCSSGLLDIYTKAACEGIPTYELLIFNGHGQWKPLQEGVYHLRILCDNGKLSQCRSIRVSSLQSQQQILREETRAAEYILYLLLLAFIITLGLLIHHNVQHPTTTPDKKKVKKKNRKRKATRKQEEKKEEKELERIKKRVG